MTDKELRELESLAVDQDRLFDPAAVIALIAEVRRLNRMVDKAMPILADGMCCPPSTWTMTQERNCWSDGDGCEAHWRKYLESEVADNG